MEQAIILNRYKPLFNRGRGGFGNVQVAWDTRLQRRVAIKRISLLNSSLSDTGISADKGTNIGTNTNIATSIEEARTAALLNNPNIVAVYDFEVTATEALIIMENVDGPTLTELMASSTELLDIDTITAVLDGMVAALEFAHENQVLHLDIKPDNILIDHSGHIKVSDFGLAELAGWAGFGEPQGGTIGYMPPEQLEMGHVDARTDLWALAALAYLLLTGTNPFFGLSAQASLAHIVDEPVPLPSTLRADLNPQTDPVLLAALDGEITERQPNVAAFWAKLHPYLGRVSPGRRQLKRRVQIWAGQEQSGLIGADQLNVDQLGADQAQAKTGYREDDWSAKANVDNTDNSANYSGLANEVDDEAYESYETYESYEPSQSSNRKQRQPKQARQKKAPIWQRTSPRVKTVLARLISALGSGTMGWLGLSSIAYLGRPVDQAASYWAIATSSPVYGEADFAFILRLVICAAIAVLTFISPSLGAIAAVLALSIGVFFTGNWFIGIIVLVGGLAWWLLIGRRSAADATVFTLAPLLIMVPVLPLLAGYFENWKRAAGTALTAAILSALIIVLTVTPQTMEAFGGFRTELLPLFSTTDFREPIISLVINPLFWTTVFCWVLAATLMSLLCSRPSRSAHVLGAVLATLLLAVAYIGAPILFWSTDIGMDYTAGLWETPANLLGIPFMAAINAIPVVISLAIAIFLIVFAVDTQPFENQKKSN